MKAYELALATLGVWRLTHLLQAEDGPWDLVVRLRRAAGEGFAGQLLDCFECLSLWIAAPFAWAFGASWRERLLLWLALSAVAIFLERLTARPAAPPPANYVEDEEDLSWPVAANSEDSSTAPAPRRERRPSATSSATSGERR